MAQPRILLGAALLALVGALSACGGGSGGGYGAPATSGGGGGGPTPKPTQPPGSNQQVVKVALPTTAMGTNTSAYGPIGGYTQTGTSQTLGFAPGQQIMILNAQSANSGVPHTLGDTGSATGFPSTPGELSTSGNTGAGGTFKHGFQSGTIQPGQMAGPFTLKAGTYFIGCAYHYQSETMRDVLLVAPNAGPGPAATPPPGASPPPYSGPSGSGY